MEISKSWLSSKGACSEGRKWFEAQTETDGLKIVKKLLKGTVEHRKWANWLITRLMTHEQQIQYAIFAAREVLHIFEAKYPKDIRPRKSIEAAEAYLADPSATNKKAAAAAAAAYAAAYDAAAAAAADAAYAAAAADAAAAAAAAAADAADAAAAAADAAAAAAAYAAAAAAAADAMRRKILEYGISLLEEK